MTPATDEELILAELREMVRLLASMDARLAKAEVLYDNPAMRWARGRKDKQ